MPELFPTQSATAVAEPEVAEIIEVDLDAEVIAEHPDADINATLPLPPGGQKYIVRLGLLDRGEQENPSASMTKKEKKPFITVGLELELVDESSEFHGFKMTDYINSLVQQRRQTSPVHFVMSCIGEVLPNVIKLKDLIAKVKTALESRPLIPVIIEWKGSVKTGPGKYDWTEVFKRMTDFPKDPESDGRLQIATWTDPKTGQKHEVRAQAYIYQYLQAN